MESPIPLMTSPLKLSRPLPRDLLSPFHHAHDARLQTLAVGFGGGGGGGGGDNENVRNNHRVSGKTRVHLRGCALLRGNSPEEAGRRPRW